VGTATVILLAPACTLFAVFVVYPIFASIRLSLYDWNGVGPMTFVGLANYRELAADAVFHAGLGNNLRWLACYIAAPVAGLLLALFLHRAGTALRIVRTPFFIPFVMSQVVVGLVFSWFFNARFGLVNELLGLAGISAVSPLDSETWSLYPMIAAGLWPQIAYCMILYTTGLATIPGDSIDAARVDGARGVTLLRSVIVPQLRPVHFLVGMVCAVAALRSFDYVMIMTLGGPYNSSTVLAFYMYEQTFVALRYGYGAAIASVLLCLMSAIIVALLVRMFQKER
jgi:multiple sugar transport system permease protein